MSLLVALMLGFADPAATTVRGKVTPPARADDEALPSPFRLDQAPFEFERVPLAGGNGLELANVRFPSPLTTPHPENNTVYGELFRPRGVKRPPCAIVLHIAGGDFPLARFVASMLAHRGTAALFVKLPYYGERRPPGGKIRMLSADMERSLTSMRQAVLDLRRCCDWIAAQPDLDGDRIGVIGISLGAIVGGLASAIEPRLSHACLVMGGAQLQHVMYESSERDADRMKQAWEAVGGTR
ncbi:MAG TPA: alpha/beta hydrolase family protein, partial [Planctomycetia bacterium]|nr:alpha/beta hydrolase family protein [Planctomycetia bacterium]